MPDKIEKNWTIKKRKTILMPNGKGRGVNGRNFGDKERLKNRSEQ